MIWGRKPQWRHLIDKAIGMDPEPMDTDHLQYCVEITFFLTPLKRLLNKALCKVFFPRGESPSGKINCAQSLVQGPFHTVLQYFKKGVKFTQSLDKKKNGRKIQDKFESCRNSGSKFLIPYFLYIFLIYFLAVGVWTGFALESFFSDFLVQNCIDYRKAFDKHKETRDKPWEKYTSVGPK